MKKRSASRTIVILATVLTICGGINRMAFANLCSSPVSCALELSEGNTGSGFGTGNFGIVDLELSGNSVMINIDLADGFQLVKTGFPGSVGFVDDLGGGLTIGALSSALYSGYLSDALTDLHFDGFGYASDAVATSGPHAGNGLNSLSFSVTGSGLGDVNELLQSFGGPAGQGPVYFVADVYNGNASEPGAGNTGLVAVTGSSTRIPEPGSLAIYGASLVALGLLPRRSHQRG